MRPGLSDVDSRTSEEPSGGLNTMLRAIVPISVSDVVDRND